MTKMWFSLLIHLPKWPLIPKKKHYNAKYWWVGDQLWALMPHPFFLFLFCVLLQNEVGEVFFHHHRWCLSEITRVVGHEITRVTYMAFYQIGGSCDFGGKKKRREEKREKKGRNLPIKSNHLCQGHLIPKQLNKKGTTTRYPKYLW